MKIKEMLKKFWHLLWKDESIKGWIFSIIILIIFIKLIFFPALNFATGTKMPLAIVESCSMYHKTDSFFSKNFDEWWKSNRNKYLESGITKEQFENFKLKNGFSKGDILFMNKAKPENLKIGDIILFEAQQKNPIIHRIIKIEDINGEYIFTTMGDNNPYSLNSTNNIYSIDETAIKKEQLVGKAVFKIAPFVGWGKLIFFEFTKQEEERGICKN